jgi:hypothetical protein
MAMDEAQLRRHLSAPRTLVLDILAEEGDADEAQPTFSDSRAWSGSSCGG